MSAVGSRGISSCHDTRKHKIETTRAVVVLRQNLLSVRGTETGFRATVAVLLKGTHLDPAWYFGISRCHLGTPPEEAVDLTLQNDSLEE
jgi:hypothetical protein